MAIAFANNASTSLANAILSTDTSMLLQSGAGFPALTSPDYFYGTIEELGAGKMEIVKVTGITGNTITSMIRAQDGTTAQSFSAGATFSLRIPRISIIETTPEGSEFFWMMNG